MSPHDRHYFQASKSVGVKPLGSQALKRLKIKLRNFPSTRHTMVARTIAIFDIFLDSVGIAIGLMFLAYLTTTHELNDAEKGTLLEMGYLGVGSGTPSKLGMGILFLYIIYMTVELVFAIFLLVGIGNKSIKLCDLWITFALFNLFLKGVQLVYVLSLGRETLEGALSYFCEPLIRLCMFYIIYDFTQELKTAQAQITAQSQRRFRGVNFYLIPGNPQQLGVDMERGVRTV